jgi:LuxR family maltose regulon positive regulatory protein
MAADAQAALEQLPAADPWRPYGLLVHGVARVLLEQDERADALLAEAAETAERLGAGETRMLALAERSLLADTRGDHAAADELIADARGAGRGLEKLPSSALPLAASARMLVRQGRWAETRKSLLDAQRLLPGITEALPWLAVQTRLELVATYAMLRDPAPARLLLAAVDGLLDGRDLGVLGEQKAVLEAEVSKMPANGRAVRLTAAELRLLPMLATHLSFREIGDQFYLSRHTVKTQAISAYRKLGASSRTEAVERAEHLGLIEALAGGCRCHVLIPTG